MSWKEQLANGTNQWGAVEAYADERIASLTDECVSPESTEQQIRQAQAGIIELQRLKSLPAMLAAEVRARQSTGSRKEY